MTRPLTRRFVSASCLLAAACGGGTESNPVGGAEVPVQVLACRARVDSPVQFAEIALRSERNLGTSRVADRTGTERHVRLHPDGTTVVFARERTGGDPDSREIHVSSTDGSRPESRRTENGVVDDEPCWSPDGERVLFASTRSGISGLWSMATTTGDASPFLLPPPGNSDSAPDWSRATDRVVWSRREADGRQRLWLAQGDGSGSVQLTDGGASVGGGTGDFAPAFAPDGTAVVFVRRLLADAARLCVVDVATGTVTTLLQPQGEVGTPRWAPAGDRIWFGLAEPTAGRATLRLAVIAANGGVPVLVWPDERWRLEGLDLAPTLPAAVAAAAPVPLDVTDANLQIAAGAAVFGVRSQLVAIDDDEFRILSATIDGREVAGINCRFDLPVSEATDTLELRIRAVARATRVGGDSTLRMSIYNPVDERFDTAVEIVPANTASHTLEFRTSSLRHVTNERQLRVTVIADVVAGAACYLAIDQVAVELVARGGS